MPGNATLVVRISEAAAVPMINVQCKHKDAQTACGMLTVWSATLHIGKLDLTGLIVDESAFCSLAAHEDVPVDRVA